MSLTFRCGECGHQYTVPDHLAGKWVKCKHCDSTLEVPGPPQPTPAAPASPAAPKSPTPQRPVRKQPLKQARPLSTPSTPAPIPEAVLLPDPAAQVAQPAQLPSRPVPPRATPPSPQPAARPAPAQPARPAPQPAPRSAPVRPASRARISPSGGSSVDRKLIIYAVSAVGGLLAVVALLMLVMFSSDPAAERETAGGSSSRAGGTTGAEGLGVVDFTRQPSVQFGAPRTMSSEVPGVVWREIQLSGPAGAPAAGGKLWVYLPSGSHEPGSLECVLIGPAGSTVTHGLSLDHDAQAEHYPYAQQGFAVVAFEIDGPLSEDKPPDDEYRDAYVKFTAAAAGVLNARVALEYATAEMPEVDPHKIFVAGHSSAGTVALLCAQHVDGLTGCVAYAPCSDLEESLADLVTDIDGVLPNVRQYMKDGSPSSYVDRLRCPVMIFHAIDDQIVRLSESNRFVQRAKSLGQDVTLRTRAQGGHYNAMIDEGIDEAVRWMNATQRAATPLASNPSPPLASNPSPPPASSPSAPLASSPTPPPSPPQKRELPRATPGFAAPNPDDTTGVQAHIHFKIISFPRSGDPATIARDALRTVVWVDLASIRVDRATSELIIGASGTMVNSNTAKIHLEQAGFVIGGASYKPVRN